jgi:FMN phosphatase YigB (HAD superfamily)
MGALNAGWQAIHLSPEGIQHKEPVITVKSLKEIEELF